MGKEKIHRDVVRAYRGIRNVMALELGLAEIFAEGSVIMNSNIAEIGEDFNPEIHEACNHVPINVTYDALDGKITNLGYVKGVIRKAGAQAYSFGKPFSFNAPDSGSDVLVSNFPTQFYRFRRD